MFGRASFEVQLYKEGRWAISEVFKSEDAARKKATELFALKTTRGVRIVKELHFSGSSHRESEIFVQMKEEKEEEDLSVSSVEHAPVCEKVSDYYKTASRTTMARLFGKYLEKQQITPLEMLHSHANLKRMINFQTMVPSAVDKIATLHARVTGSDAKTRRDEIFDAVDAIAKRAREVEKTELPALKDSTLDEMLKGIDRLFSDDGEREYMANVALVRESINWRGWLGKMSELLPMATSQTDKRALTMVDEMMSDILNAKTVIKDIIGVSKHLGDAIMRILDLVEGKCEPTKFAAEDLLTLLNKLFAQDLLPRSKKVLYERVERDLRGPVRLTNSEHKADDKLFLDKMIDRIITDSQVVGGHALAHGLTERWARLYNVGGAGGRRKAMDGMCEKVHTGRRIFVYLLALYDPDADPDMKAAIIEQLSRLSKEMNTIQRIAPEMRTEKTRLQAVSAIQRLVLDSELENDVRAEMAKRFDDIVVDYIVSEGVIERLDNKRLAFRERANRLVTFCAAGVLTEGRATEIARKSVTSYLRRKNFVSEFTSDIDKPEDKEAAVREFYRLLAQTGFEVGG